jgi:hypothetical protein
LNSYAVHPWNQPIPVLRDHIAVQAAQTLPLLEDTGYVENFSVVERIFFKCAIFESIIAYPLGNNYFGI